MEPNYDELIDRRRIPGMTAGARLHLWVADYNWDVGLAPMWPIVESPNTPFGTALLIYWRLGGPYLEVKPGSVNEEAKRLQDLVREHLLTGYYQDKSVPFDPSAGLTRVQLYQLRKAGVPALLLGPGDAPGEEIA